LEFLAQLGVAGLTYWTSLVSSHSLSSFSETVSEAIRGE